MTRSLAILLVLTATLLSGCDRLFGDRDRSPAADSLAVADSTAVADSIAAVDSLAAADSIAADRADSIRADSLAAADSIAALDPAAAPQQAPSDTTFTDRVLARIDSLAAQVSRLAEADTSATDTPAVERFLADLGWKLFQSFIVLLVAYYVIRLHVWLLTIRAEHSATRRLTHMKAIPVVRIIIWSIAIYYVIRVVFAFDERSLIVAGGAIGVAVGFAAQDILKNIFGGIIIILDQPFQVGDKVRIGGTYGEVVSIGLRSTRIVTSDDNHVTVPNTQIVDGQVANANKGALDCQVVTEIYLPGWVDVVKAKKIAFDAAATSKYVYLNKPIVVLVEDMFDHGFLTRIIVKAYVLDTRYERVFASDVTERAKSEYLKQGMLQPVYLVSDRPARYRFAGDDGADGGRAGSDGATSSDTDVDGPTSSDTNGDGATGSDTNVDGATGETT